MEAKFYRVMKVGDVVEVTTRESGKLNKRTLVLQDLGGSKYENEYVVVLLGNAAALSSQRVCPRVIVSPCDFVIFKVK